MPTIEQLAPTTAAADTDEILISQNGITRKATRAQVLAGVQSALAIPSGTLLGRVSAGIGAPETISVGKNLLLTGSTLTATAAPFTVSALPAGTVPVANNMVPLSQSGTNTSVTFAQFMGGLSNIPNLNASQVMVTPTGSSQSVKLADLASTILPTSGGAMTGPLTLSGPPTVGSQATTKAYVDSQVATALPIGGGTLSGPLTLSANPVVPQHATTKTYVDTQIATAIPRSGGTISGPLTLAADPVAPLQAATKEYVDARVLRNGDTLTGSLILASDPTAPLQATTKGYVDTQIATALPKTGGTLSGSLSLPADPTSALQASTKQYVDTRVLRNGDTMVGALTLAADPVAPLHAATKEYVDNQVGTALPRAGGSLIGPLTLAGDPSTALQAATKQYTDTRVFRNGDTLTGALVLASDPTVPLQAATKQYVDAQVGSTLAKSGGVMTGALTLAADPVASSQAATKHYVDSSVATSLPLSGGTLSGTLSLAANPSAANHATNKQYVDAQIATTLPLSGGTLTGGLTLAASPTVPMGAATKQYVDAAAVGTGVINVKAPPYNALLNGTTDDTAAFKAAYVAAAAGSVIYVPFGVTVLQNPATWGVALTKRVKWIVDGTTLVDGTPLACSAPNGNPAEFSLPGIVTGNTGVSAEFSIGTSQITDIAVQHSSYIVNHTGGTSGTVAANARTDTIIYNSPNNYIWGGLDRLVWAGTQTPSASTPAQHVGRYVQSIRAAITTGSNGVALPQPQLWAACLEMRDSTGQPSSMSNATITVEMDLVANGRDDANSRTIQSLVIAQNDRTGAPVEVGSIINVNLLAGSTGSAKNILNVAIPYSTAVINTTNALQLSGASAILLAAGHSIAFEASGAHFLVYDSGTATLRWNQGSLSYVVGKGITIGPEYVISGATSLASYSAGSGVFLTGSGSYNVGLPAASSVAPGVGFTFSNIGSASVTVSPSGIDAVDNGPVVLRSNDRYHIVSDGQNTWREIFRTNSVSPHFSAPPVLPSYTVSSLPSAPGAGAKAFATNGRKPSEPSGSGTGVEVFFDGSHWISSCSGTQVSN
jgi:hypothetical protein